MCCNHGRNIIANVNTREKFEFSVFIVKTKCITATQLRSPTKIATLSTHALSEIV